ncbi:MAG: hypothetical protein ACRYG4_24360 [Janthinobacterium lividum]
MSTVVRTVTLIGALLAVAVNAQTPPPADSPSVVNSPVVVKIIPATIPQPSDAQRYKTENVCRSSIETGSLVTKRKSCLTRKQWEYVDQAHREEARKMMMENMGHPPGA